MSPRSREGITKRRKDAKGIEEGFVVRHRTNGWWGTVERVLGDDRYDVLFKQRGRRPDMMTRNIAGDCIETVLSMHRRHGEHWRRGTGSPPLEDTIDPGAPWRPEEKQLVADGYDELGSPKLAELLGRSATSVQHEHRKLKKKEATP